MFRGIFLTILFILTGILPACQNPMNDKLAKEISEEVKQQKETFLVKGLSPEVKLSNLVNYFNKRWRGHVWMSADYRFIPIPPIRDIVFSTITIFPKIDSERQIGESPNTDSAIQEIIFIISSEIQPKEIYTTILRQNRADQFIFLNSGEEIRRNGVSVLEKSAAKHLKNPIFSFSLDNLREKSSYEPYKSGLKDEKLKRLADDWNKRWAGEVFVQGEDSLSENDAESVTYLIEAGFNTLDTAEYLAKINKILGRIVYDSLRIKNIQNIKFFVIHANGDYLYFYGKDGSLDRARKYMEQAPETKMLDDWSHFFVIKPFIVSF